MKTCRDCGETKPLVEFHKHTTCRDGRDVYCKMCKNARSKAYYTKGQELPYSTRRVKELLEANGIPVGIGSGSGIPFVDLVAFGCVPVEAKASSDLGNGRFHFTYSTKQRNSNERMIFVFIARRNNDTENRVFVVPSDKDWVRYARTGNRRRAMTFWLNGSSSSRNVNVRLILPYENRFDLIWQAFMDHSHELRKTHSK